MQRWNSEFEKQSTQFLGFIISTEWLSMDSQKVSAILDLPTPSDRKGVQRFVGFANFYGKYTKDFSTIIAPITQLISIHASSGTRKLKECLNS